MKSSPFLSLLAVLLGCLAMASAQVAQLDPHAARYTQDRQTLDDTRAQQLETLRSRYTTALTAARAEATKASKGGALTAIDAEIADVKSDVHAPAPSPDLPRSLSGARREFLTGIEALDKAIALRVKDLDARYLQTLNAFGQNAARLKDDALAAAVAREKTRLTATATPAPPALHKNVIVNGDFSATEANGMPTGWQPKGENYQGNDVPWQNDALVIQEGSERFLRFRRAASVRVANVSPKTPILIPERAKAAVVSVRIRVEGLVPGQNYDRYPGIAIKALDATGKSPGHASAAANENTRWRLFTARLILQPGAKTLDLTVGPCAAAGICDFDDVTVKFE